MFFPVSFKHKRFVHADGGATHTWTLIAFWMTFEMVVRLPAKGGELVTADELTARRYVERYRDPFDVFETEGAGTRRHSSDCIHTGQTKLCRWSCDPFDLDS